jgi:hypothetical protein
MGFRKFLGPCLEWPVESGSDRLIMQDGVLQNIHQTNCPTEAKCVSGTH